MHNIILIEDNESFGYILAEYLSLHDYSVDWAKTGTEGIEMITHKKYDLGVFDIMLPDQNGYEVAAWVKKQVPYLPFIFLSAKSLKVDKLKGFKLGADDYVTKPIDEELFLAKVKALIKRTMHQAPLQEEYEIGQYLFQPNLQKLHWQEDVVQLTKREAELLQMLCQCQGQLLARKRALQEIWGATDEFSRKSMDVFISHLRKYLAKDEQVKITNIHGKGFVLTVSGRK
ncbi:MAG: response regulator transcription factor [Saprospiraceae bacterium]|nr:response regulator transcription factor [Saprospiraceae bacterium]